ncbi:hypothetical protein Pelo_12852 [Pelomyxa schiedti]|nr:hypothetical protein Pelo_12852 [Pelomyxa schiedti]
MEGRNQLSAAAEAARLATSLDQQGQLQGAVAAYNRAVALMTSVLPMLTGEQGRQVRQKVTEYTLRVQQLQRQRDSPSFSCTSSSSNSLDYQNIMERANKLSGTQRALPEDPNWIDKRLAMLNGTKLPRPQGAKPSLDLYEEPQSEDTQVEILLDKIKQDLKLEEHTTKPREHPTAPKKTMTNAKPKPSPSQLGPPPSISKDLLALAKTERRQKTGIPESDEDEEEDYEDSIESSSPASDSPYSSDSDS